MSTSDDLLRDIAVTLKKWNIPRTKAWFSSNGQPIRLRGYDMRYLIASIIAVLLNCNLAYSQENRSVVKSQSAPAQISIAVQGEGLGLQASENTSNRPLPSLDQLGNRTGDFVFINGAAYMRLGGSLFPMSGGGGSGCFSLDLPQRIRRIDDFLRRLEDQEKPNLQDHENKRGLSTSSREQLSEIILARRPWR